MIVETPRLIIRNWTAADAESLCRLSREPGFSDFSVTGYKDFSKTQAIEWINKENERFQKLRLGKFACVLKTTDEIIGISGIFQRYTENEQNAVDPERRNQIEINYRYPKIYQGFGYATEGAKAVLAYGFKNLNLDDIHAFADLTNLRSHRVLQRLGMERIGETEYSGIKAGHWRLASKNFEK